MSKSDNPANYSRWRKQKLDFPSNPGAADVEMGFVNYCNQHAGLEIPPTHRNRAVSTCVKTWGTGFSTRWWSQALAIHMSIQLRVRSVDIDQVRGRGTYFIHPIIYIYIFNLYLVTWGSAHVKKMTSSWKIHVNHQYKLTPKSPCTPDETICSNL